MKSNMPASAILANNNLAIVAREQLKKLCNKALGKQWQYI